MFHQTKSLKVGGNLQPSGETPGFAEVLSSSKSSISF